MWRRLRNGGHRRRLVASPIEGWGGRKQLPGGGMSGGARHCRCKELERRRESEGGNCGGGWSKQQQQQLQQGLRCRW